MGNEIDGLVKRYGLKPHPEGGFFRETYRSKAVVHDADTRKARAASTAILFLLTPGSFSAFHRIRSDEVWHYYAGDPITLHMLSPEAGYRASELGPEGEFQVVVPAGAWQAARCGGLGYSLCGCTVAPGFEFEDFELGAREDLAAAFPEHRGVVEELTRG